MKGTIYRIISISHPEIQYVGSTGDTTAKRWWQHKNHYKLWKDGKRKDTVSIYPYFEEYGIADFRMILIKEYEVIDKQHLSSYEQMYINRIKCVNKVNPWTVGTSNCKWLKKEYRRLHYLKNQEHIKQKAKIHQAENREHREQYLKEYQAANKATIKAKRSVKIQCACGSLISKQSKTQHEKSAKHKAFIAL